MLQLAKLLLPLHWGRTTSEVQLGMASKKTQEASHLRAS